MVPQKNCIETPSSRQYSTFAPCTGIRNPKSFNFLRLESGILSFGIRNPVPGIRNPTRGIWNPTSSITMESRPGMYYTVSSNYIINHHRPPFLSVSYHHHPPPSPKSVWSPNTYIKYCRSLLRLGSF